jgi:hypothetical protein
MSVKLFDSDKHIIYKNSSGYIETVKALCPVQIDSSAGLLVPQFSISDDSSRKKEAPLIFHPNGHIKSCPLEEATTVKTPIGDISCELLTFYENGALKRIFPLNGKLSGFWTQENEYKLAEVLCIPTTIGEINAKPIFLQFYESGELETIAFWPRETIQMESELGRMEIRNGISFHKNGAIKSCEPLNPYSILTPIGIVEAWDPDPDGITAAHWSLCFNDQKKVTRIHTISTRIAVMHGTETLNVFSPGIIPSVCSDSDKELVPLIISFTENKVGFAHGDLEPTEVALSADFLLSRFVPEEKIKPACI